MIGAVSGSAAFMIFKDTEIANAMHTHPFVLMGEPELGWFAGSLGYMAYKRSARADLDLLLSGLSGLSAYIILRAL